MKASQVIWIVILSLMLGLCVFWPKPNQGTANLILDSKRACEAQTGKPCAP